MDRTDYLSSARQVIESEASPGQLITAAKVGLLLRRSLGGPRWQEFGFRSLKDLLVFMEQRGWVRMGETDSGALAIQIDAGVQLPLDHPKASNKLNVAPSRRLRGEYWIAFAVEEPRGKRFVNRQSGEVRMGLKAAPSPTDDWLEIEPIGEQKAWAEEFLREHDLLGNTDLMGALGAPDWYRTFPEALRSVSLELVTNWNRQRSAQVAEYVRQWCQEHAMNLEIPFQKPFRQRRDQKRATFPAPENLGDEKSMRKVVLDALATVPTDWLLDLPIPPKYIFRVLTTRSGRS